MPGLKLPPLPVEGQIIFYIDEDRDFHLAKVLNVRKDDFLNGCPPGTHWDNEGDKSYIKFPEGTTYGELKFPRGFSIDLTAFYLGRWTVFENVPYNPVQTSHVLEESIAPKCWVFK